MNHTEHIAIINAIKAGISAGKAAPGSDMAHIIKASLEGHGFKIKECKQETADRGEDYETWLREKEAQDKV